MQEVCLTTESEGMYTLGLGLGLGRVPLEGSTNTPSRVTLKRRVHSCSDGWLPQQLMHLVAWLAKPSGVGGKKHKERQRCGLVVLCAVWTEGGDFAGSASLLPVAVRA